MKPAGTEAVERAKADYLRRTRRRPTDDPCLSSLLAAEGPRSASSRSAIRSAVLTAAGNTSVVSSNLARRRLTGTPSW